MKSSPSTRPARMCHAGYGTPRDTVPDDNAYILLLRRHLTSAHTCLQRAKPLVDEYETEYACAQECAAIQIWASMQRHKGDPRWEYKTDNWIVRGEVCT